MIRQGLSRRSWLSKRDHGAASSVKFLATKANDTEKYEIILQLAAGKYLLTPMEEVRGGEGLRMQLVIFNTTADENSKITKSEIVQIVFSEGSARRFGYDVKRSPDDPAREWFCVLVENNQDEREIAV